MHPSQVISVFMFFLTLGIFSQSEMVMGISLCVIFLAATELCLMIMPAKKVERLPWRLWRRHEGNTTYHHPWGHMSGPDHEYPYG